MKKYSEIKKPKKKLEERLLLPYAKINVNTKVTVSIVGKILIATMIVEGQMYKNMMNLTNGKVKFAQMSDPQTDSEIPGAAWIMLVVSQYLSTRTGFTKASSIISEIESAFS